MIVHDATVAASDTVGESMLEQPPHSVVQRAKALQSGRELKYIGSENIVGGNAISFSFHFGSAADSSATSYGSVHVLWDRQSKSPLWAFNWFGDFQPHSISLLDLDQDGDLDLFFLVGYEDVFETHAYLQVSNATRAELFESVYVNKNDYSVLLDIDGDGHAEILDSGHNGQDHVESLCKGFAWVNPTIPDPVLSAIGTEYWRLSGNLDRHNFRYGMLDWYPALSMGIFDPIRILRIENGTLIDVTSQFQEHLLWRLEQLNRIRSANAAACLPLINKAIQHLKVLLNVENS